MAWAYWVNTSNSTTGSTATTWTQWTTTTATTASATDSDVWGYWTANTSTSGSYCTTWETWSEQTEAVKLTKAQRKELRKQQAAERAAAAQRQREYAAQQREAEAKRKAAEKRAETLLLGVLTKEQEKAWREERAIFVTSQSGKRFKIKDGRAHNIFELNEEGEAIREYCVHVRPNCPNADNVLAQKLMLEHQEEQLLRLANKWDLVHGARV